MKRIVLLCLTGAGWLPAAGQPPVPAIEASTPVNPPAWAVLERRLMEVMGQAALKYHAQYVRAGGTLAWKTEGLASLDDLPESFYNFPLLYALGGDERLKQIAFHEWSATVRQLTYDFPIYHNEFPKYGDWFHIGEGIIYFYLLGLADPTDHETVARARRFAGLYMNEDPAAPNYDAKLKIIRSGENGSLGPVLNDYSRQGCPCILPPWYGSKPPEPYVRSVTGAPPYLWTREMAGYGLPLEDVPGIKTPDDLKDPSNARRMGIEVMKRIYPGDVPVNLGATSLVLNAYLFTGEQKYADWVKEYTRAWVERTRANGGITPDNVGLSGKAGENQNGNWWGGLYGWRWPHGYHSVGQALHLAAANAMLASGGDAGYLELPRSNMDSLIALGKEVDGSFRVPTRKNAEGWWAWAPMDRSYMASLWFMSRDPADWARIEKIRQREKSDWKFVEDMHNKMDAGHDAPWLRYLAGDFPDYPEKILASAYGQVTARMNRIRDNMVLLDTDPARWEKADRVDLTQVSEHHWQGVNPVTTEALVQLMLGAPQLQYNGGLLHASVRYFDPAGKRPGLPADTAALVRKIDAAGVELELVNLSPLEPRVVQVQAGTFGEHSFTSVRYAQREEAGRRNQPPVVRQSDVNGRVFEVRLAPGTAITLQAGMKRFANKPTYAFPWHGERIPVR
jgi:hypothetical protein